MFRHQTLPLHQTYSLCLSPCLHTRIWQGFLWPSQPHFVLVVGRTPFCKETHCLKHNIRCVPVVATLMNFIQFPAISSWVNGHLELMAVHIGNKLFWYRRAARCWKLLILLSQFPRHSMSATCQASDRRWVL